MPVGVCQGMCKSLGLRPKPQFLWCFAASPQNNNKKDLRGWLRRIGIRLRPKVAPASSRSVVHRDRLEAGATFGIVWGASQRAPTHNSLTERLCGCAAPKIWGLGRSPKDVAHALVVEAQDLAPLLAQHHHRLNMRRLGEEIYRLHQI